MPEWKKVDVPQGRFIGWGKKGQQVTIDVLDYQPNGGTDFNNNQCPLVTGTLVDDCDNYTDKGTKHERLKAGELVSVTCGQANLRKGMLACDPKRGDLVRLTYTDTYTASKGEGKVIEVEHAPGAGGKGYQAPEDGDDAVAGDDL